MKEIEALAEKLHSIYQDEVKRQGDTIRHPDAYNLLSEKTKNYDRVLARYILEREKKLRDGIEWIRQTIHRAHHDGSLEEWWMWQIIGSGIAVKLVDYIEQSQGIAELDCMAEQLWAEREGLA